MASASTIKTWYVVHKWTSLICTAFLLIICLTGLPLVFHHEIEHWLDDGKPLSDVPAGTPRANFDKLVAQARSMYPAEVVDYLSFDPDEPQAFVGMAKAGRRPDFRPRRAHGRAHRRRAAGRSALLAGPLFLHGHHAVAACGPVRQPAGRAVPGLHGPAVLRGHRVGRGAVRSVHEETRIRHGARLALDPAQMAGPAQPAGHRHAGLGLRGGTDGRGQRAVHAAVPPVAVHRAGRHPGALQGPGHSAELASVQAAADTARQAMPGTEISFIAFPGNAYGSPHHYLVWMRGDTRSPRA